MAKYNSIKVDKKNCTSCGACVIACPVNCISLKEDEFGYTYPHIDKERCINCGKCKSICHLSKNNFNSKVSDNVYAAWSSNEEIRNKSASGGIASEIYSYCLENNIHCFGVAFDKEKGAFYKEILSASDIEKCRNSKYVESRMNETFSIIKKYLKNNEKVVFIGLPCHVSALLSFVGGRNENLTTIDMLCHGTTPFKYLKEHIGYIENKTKHTCDELSFRDSKYGTNKYRFTLKNSGKIFYNKGVYEDDKYQYGYHKSLIYRENCYNCHYAKKERVGDLTISDFSGLGTIEKWEQSWKSVSCLIVSETTNGKKLFDEMVKEGRLVCSKRPMNEAYLYDSMFTYPSIPHKGRKIFLDEYSSGSGFEKAATLALKKDIRKNRLRNLLFPLRLIKSILVKLKKKIYKIIKKTQ